MSKNIEDEISLLLVQLNESTAMTFEETAAAIKRIKAEVDEMAEMFEMEEYSCAPSWEVEASYDDSSYED